MSGRYPCEHVCLRMILALVLWACVPPEVEAAAPFWPEFHGPGRDNMSRESGLLTQWPEGGPPLVWTTRGIGQGFSSVAIADGTMYTAGNTDEETVVTALDMEGRIVWQAETGTAWTGSSPGTRSTPTIDASRLFYESPLGDLVCLDTKAGERIWGVNILEKFGSRNITWALAESPLVDGEKLICCPGGPQTSMVALDKTDGHLIWTAPTVGDLAGYASPVLVEYHGLRMIVTMTSGAVIGVAAESGELLWRFEHLTQSEENILAPLFHDGCVFVSTPRTGSALFRLNVQGRRVTPETVWRSKELDNHHGGVLLVDGYLYGTSYKSNQAKWICLDWKTGKMMYAERGVGKGSLTFADGLLYTLGERGRVGLLRPTPTRHDLISSFELPQGGQGPVWAHPVVCGARLYLRHGDFLYAFDVKGK
jgi:outer membrane protein assembly factor BamB